jgi:hypothetical protein
VAQLRLRHKRSLSMEADAVLNDADMPNKRWDVMSENKTEFYSVPCISESCNCRIKCDACLACICRFSCSCIDNSIRYNVCKHIHLVCRSEDHAVNEFSRDTSSRVISTDFHDNTTDQLVINTDTRKESDELEMSVIKQSLNKVHSVQHLKSELEETKNSLLSLLPILEMCESAEQLQAVRKKLHEIPRLVDALVLKLPDNCD